MKRSDMSSILSLWFSIILICAGCAEVQKPRLEDAMAYNNRAGDYVNKGRYDQAISDCDKALEINPKLAMAYVTRAVAYVKKGQYDQAISDCNKALEINPKLAMAYVTRAVACVLRREYEKAWEDANKVQDLGHEIHPEFLKALRKASGRAN